MRRQVPLFIIICVGWVLLFSVFIPPMESWGEEASLFFDIIAVFAFFLGGGNLIRVHASTNGLPGVILHEQQLGVFDVAVGGHTIALDPPLVLESPSFCVSLIGGAPANNTSLGVAVVDGKPAPQASFIRIDGLVAACKITEWLDLAAADPPVTPNGPWCIGAHVAAP